MSETDPAQQPQQQPQPPNSPNSAAATNATVAGVEEPKSDTEFGRYVWNVKNYSRLREKRMYSETFELVGVKWNVLFFPRGNDVDCLSVYLNAPDAKTLGYTWQKNVRFTVELVNQTSPEQSFKRSATHRFTSEEADWGFTQFIKLAQALDTKGGFYKDDKLLIGVEVEVIKETSYGGYGYWNSYDSKKETGFLGLRNQGATCYMNSLLQSYYHLSGLRRAVYQLPTVQDQPTKSIPLALQRIFYKLEFGDKAVSTKELTKSFGWNTIDSFTQHDVQELNRVLCDNLQGKMKSTKAEGTIEKLFQGKMKNYIKCINIDYESAREEPYYDISLNVKGCRDLYNSFEKYVEVEMLDGDNKYHAEGHGLQTAKKGCAFLQFPPVLHLQLKRFEYDPYRDSMVKVNDKYGFPLHLDLSRFLAEEADKSIAYNYTLVGVLVHSGDVHGGHYYAFIKPALQEEWFRFDDDRVTKSSVKEAVEDNFGGEEEYVYTLYGKKMTSTQKKFSNAYMLVYVRDSDFQELMGPLQEAEIPVHLKERFDQEAAQDEAREQQKREAHLFMPVKVLSDRELRGWRRFDLYKFDAPGIPEFRAKKASTLKEFKKVLADHFHVPVERQRFWNWVSRQNKTIRPDQPYTAQDEDKTLEDLSKNSPELRLYLEISLAPLGVELPLFSQMHEDDILLFFKCYCPEKEGGLCVTVGSTVVKNYFKMHDLIPLMNKSVGWPVGTPLIIFEEVKPTMIDPLKPHLTLKDGEISNGDILIFQRALQSNELYNINSADEYFDYLLNRQVVKFRRLDKPKQTVFELELSKKMVYDQVTKRVAEKLGTDPDKIRFTAHNTYFDQPKPAPIKRAERLTLNDMLSIYYQPNTDTLYYEVLDMTLSEMENKKALKVYWHNYKTEQVEACNVLVPRDATVADVLTHMTQQFPNVKLDPTHGSGKMRLMELWNSRVHKILRDDESVLLINEYSRIRAEEIPTEEAQANAQAGDRRVQVCHYSMTYGAVQSWGHPFFVVLKREDTWGAVKQRIQQRLGVPDEEFTKWKVAFIVGQRPEYLQDDDPIGTREFGVYEFFGLEHADNAAPRATYRSHYYEKPIKIYG